MANALDHDATRASLETAMRSLMASEDYRIAAAKDTEYEGLMSILGQPARFAGMQCLRVLFTGAATHLSNTAGPASAVPVLRVLFLDDEEDPARRSLVERLLHATELGSFRVERAEGGAVFDKAFDAWRGKR